MIVMVMVMRELRVGWMLDAQTRIAQLFFVFGNGRGRGGGEEGEWHATQTKFLQSTAAHNSRFVELVTTSDMCQAGRTGLTLTLTASHVAFYKQVGVEWPRDQEVLCKMNLKRVQYQLRGTRSIPTLPRTLPKFNGLEKLD